MTKQGYISALEAIGYTSEEVQSIFEDGVNWSMVKIEDTVRCGYKIYSADGKRLSLADDRAMELWEENNPTP